MKRLFSLILMVVGFSVFAEEKVLFSSSTTANLDGYDYAKNFELKSNTGYFDKTDLKIIEPNENGLRFIALNPPKDKSVSFDVISAYPSFLNDEDGAGKISNAADIKSIKIVATTNRPYDEVYLLYSTSPLGEIKPVKMPQNFDAVKSMEENVFVFENPNYEPDVNKRKIVNRPIIGSDTDGIYLRGFRIKTNAATGYNIYSPACIIYLKEVSVIYDKAFDDETIELSKSIQKDFGLNSSEEKIKAKEKQKIEERERIKASQKALIAE